MRYYLSILIILGLCNASLTQSWSTYSGGSNNDYVIGVASNSLGEVVATGITRSTNFPVTSGAFQSNYAGDSDLFIIKFNSLGQCQWSTYYGGSGSDGGRNVSFDMNGNIYIVGTTTSTDFPVSPGAQQQNNAGGYDAFVLKFSSSGQRLWATYLGGSNTDKGLAISTDYFGNSIVTGWTGSTNFPVISGAFQTSNAGGYDAFIVKIDSAGRRVWSTYYGGNSDDNSDEIALSNNGKLVITGYTNSSNFPVTPGCFQAFLAGYSDIYIACFDTSGSRNWATYYGGTDYDYGYGGVSITDNINVLACGWTKSTNFPVTADAFQLSNAGGYDAYLLKFDSSGNRLWATYCGGSSDDKGEGVVSDSEGNIFIAGLTGSTDFPVVPGALQNQNAGGNDAFIMKFNTAGQRIAGTYYGGSSDDFCHDFSLTPDGGVLLGGKTSSINFPVSSDCFQNHNAGQSDAFITVLNNSLIGININGENFPTEYCLFQNYPNPFNPTTKIKFDIQSNVKSEKSNVKLVVFDVLGREIATLVNEKLSPGTYEVTWDANNYPSGVYFYKLTINNASTPLSITKKMVLIK